MINVHGDVYVFKQGRWVCAEDGTTFNVKKSAVQTARDGYSRCMVVLPNGHLLPLYPGMSYSERLNSLSQPSMFLYVPKTPAQNVPVVVSPGGG